MDPQIHMFGIQPFYLYEILASTFSFDIKLNKFIPNTSCMGIRFLEDDRILMKPYPTSQTYKNIEENGLVGINFVNNIYLYALAALKEPNSNLSVRQFPEKEYNYLQFNKHPELIDLTKKIKDFRDFEFPIIREAWGIMICEKVEESVESKDDNLGISELKNQYFEIRVAKKIKNSYKHFNRAENIILEILILSTRLKIAKNLNKDSMIQEIWDKIRESKLIISRFCKNKEALKSLDLIEEYINYWIK